MTKSLISGIDSSFSSGVGASYKMECETMLELLFYNIAISRATELTTPGMITMGLKYRGRNSNYLVSGFLLMKYAVMKLQEIGFRECKYVLIQFRTVNNFPKVRVDIRNLFEVAAHSLLCFNAGTL